MINIHRHLKTSGFTLAELLIALAILGVIATFSIPKVLQAQQDGRNQAVLKTNASQLSALLYELNLKHQTQSSEFFFINNQNLIVPRLNAVKQCGLINPGNPADPCMPDAVCKPTTICQDWEYGATLHDGSSVAFTNAAGEENFILIDADGARGLNTVGKDRLVIDMDVNGKLRAAVMVFESGGGDMTTENAALYDQVF